MADNTSIEWTDATWNPITGCSVVSPGCTNCYAMKLAGTRLKHIPSRKGLTRDTKAGPVWTGEVRLNEEWLSQPLKWKRPRRIFVCAHGDLFAENVPDEWIDRVFAVMALAPQHTFQVLTKRAKRMREYMLERWQPAPARMFDLGPGGIVEMPPETEGEDREDQIRGACEPFLRQLGLVDTDRDELWTEDGNCKAMQWTWPLPNVWLGVSAEDQARADERIPELLQTPAAVRWISAEPLLGPIDFSAININGLSEWDVLQRYIRYPMMAPGHFHNEPANWPGLDWIVAGGESGRGARPMHPAWARSIRDQCAAAGVPFLFKQWGAWADHTDVDDLVGSPSEDRVLAPDGKVLGAGGRQNGKMQGSVEPDWRERGGAWMARVGKKVAGRLLDGIEHNGFPS